MIFYMNYSEWMQSAIDSINNKVKNGQAFELKSLFEACKWEQLSKGERISFGKYFANEVRERRIKKIIPVERGRNNHSKYLKIKSEAEHETTDL